MPYVLTLISIVVMLIAWVMAIWWPNGKWITAASITGLAALHSYGAYNYWQDHRDEVDPTFVERTPLLERQSSTAPTQSPGDRRGSVVYYPNGPSGQLPYTNGENMPSLYANN